MPKTHMIIDRWPLPQERAAVQDEIDLRDGEMKWIAMGCIFFVFCALFAARYLILRH